MQFVLQEETPVKDKVIDMVIKTTAAVATNQVDYVSSYPFIYRIGNTVTGIMTGYLDGT